MKKKISASITSLLKLFMYSLFTCLIYDIFYFLENVCMSDPPFLFKIFYLRSGDLKSINLNKDIIIEKKNLNDINDVD